MSQALHEPFECEVGRCRFWHWRELSQLIQQMFPEDFGDHNTGWFIRNHADDILLVVRNRRLVGFAAWGENENSDAAWLLYLGVQKNMRGQGLGAKLLKCFENTAAKRGYRAVGLSVLHENDKAQQFYETYGYEMITRDDSRVMFEKPIDFGCKSLECTSSCCEPPPSGYSFLKKVWLKISL